VFWKNALNPIFAERIVLRGGLNMDRKQLTVMPRGGSIVWHPAYGVVQVVGLREEDDDLWRVTFSNYDLGFYDRRVGVFEPFSEPQRVDGVPLL
jgi:hypothetical protein